MSIAHVFSSIVTQKKMKIKKTSPQVLVLEWVHVPKLVSVLEFFLFSFFGKFNKRRKTCHLSLCINRHLSKKIYKINNYTAHIYIKKYKINTFFLCANVIIITFENNMCSKLFLYKLAKLCVYLFFHFSCFLYVTMLEKTCSKAIIP